MRHIRPLSVFREGGTDILQEHQQQTWQCPELCAFTSGLRKWTVMSFVVASHQTISRPRFWGTIRTGISGLVANLPACRCWFDDVDGMGKKSNNLIPSPIPPCPTMSHQGDENWKLHHTCRCSPNPISIKAIPSALPAHGPSAISLSFRGHWMALLPLPLSGLPSCVSSALVNVFARMGSDNMKPPFGANLWMRRSEPK